MPRSMSGVELPAGYWSQAQAREILDKTVIVELEADLADLEPVERRVLDLLLGVNGRLQDLYEDQLHHQALAARTALVGLHEQTGRTERTGDLLALYDLFQGPIATTLDNQQLPFLPADGFSLGRNVYPWGIGADEVASWMDAHPGDRAAIRGLRTVVRRAGGAAIRRDLASLRRHPGLALLHPGLEDRLRSLRADPSGRSLYAIPYSVAWADQLVEVSRLLRQAADLLPDGDDFGTYLRLRSRDLLADDYEAGDAAWVRGTPGRLNAVLGAYETYEDGLFGSKAFFGVSILHRNEQRTRELSEALRHLQAIEDALPYSRRRTISQAIPIAAYGVVADSGAQRHVGAQILPNEAQLTRKYGRTIMLRENAIASPAGLLRRRARWQAAMAPAHHHDLTEEGVFQQTLWHELGHYLGPLEDKAERLGEHGVLLEELKAELISIRAAAYLRTEGRLSPETEAGIMAGVIIRMLLPARPIRTQTYETMWLVALNDFLEHGLLEPAGGGLGIRWERAGEVVERLLREVLGYLDGGSKADAAAFILRGSTWDDRHERLAAAVRSVERYRYARYVFPILGG